MHYNLSEITDLIKNRRSVAPEHYTTRKIHKEQVELLLNNAIWAPNHGMTQPWRFVVINGNNKAALAGLAYQAMIEGKSADEINPVKLERMVNRLNMASVVIAIIHQRDAAAKVPEWEEIAAIGAAVQNLHLTAHAYGLAGFWATPGILQNQNIRAFLELENNQFCKGFFYLGYPAVNDYKSHRKPIEYVTKWKWDE
jgi:nitroreductase